MCTSHTNSMQDSQQLSVHKQPATLRVTGGALSVGIAATALAARLTTSSLWLLARACSSHSWLPAEPSDPVSRQGCKQHLGFSYMVLWLLDLLTRLD